MTFLNVHIDTIKDLTAKAIVGGEPVWFGCDVAPMMGKDLDIWDANLFDLPGVYNTRFELSKVVRLLHPGAQLSHPTLFTRVDLIATRRVVGMVDVML